jgi:uncharacterized protein (DUF1800 family)
MLQAAASSAKRAAVPSWWSAVAVLFVASVLLASTAGAQTRSAAIGLHRAWTTTFYVDGNFDSWPDLAVAFGTSSDIGLLADVTGSGMRSPATYNSGFWHLDTNRDGAVDQTILHGGIGDKPLVADIDRDGRDELVVYRIVPGVGGVYLFLNVSTGQTSQVTFGGEARDVPLLGDMDGDGVQDLVLYRNGLWYVSLGRTGAVSRTYRFGGASDGRDVPLVFDYDGNGTDDLVIFRNGAWYVSTAPVFVNGVGSPANSPTGVQFAFGMGGDRPLYFGRGAVETADQQAARLLQQATFGPTAAEITRVKAMGVVAWVDDQLNKPKTSYSAFPWYPASRPQTPTGQTWPFCTYAQYTTTAYNASTPCNCNNQAGTTNQCQRDVYGIFQLQKQFFVNALYAPDQLRHRVAWALSQIIVTSALQDPIAYANRDYQQLLLDHAFGNFATLLTQVTVNPFMGNYLDTVNNRKGAGTRQPNENYAREILQLFSIGLWELRDDGTMLLDAFGNPVPTYDQSDITELSRVYTGWVYPPLPGQTVRLNATVSYHAPMAALETEHDTGAKRVLDLGTLSAGVTAAWDVTNANNLIFTHPNVGPFVAKQLIQHLVTSNPSPTYVRDVVAVFNNNGSGVKGDLRATVRAILLHPEARAPRNPVVSSFGKLKEPVLLVTSALRALGAQSDGVDPITRVRAMGQDVYASPTVFNYYPADYVVPGTELAGPSFGIFDATTYFTRANWTYNQLSLGATCSGNVCGVNLDPTVVSSVGTKVDYTSLAAVAADPAALVDMVDNVLLQKSMPTFMRQQIINAVAAYPSATAADRLNRARTAVYLTVSSPRFQTEY